MNQHDGQFNYVPTIHILTGMSLVNDLYHDKNLFGCVQLYYVFFIDFAALVYNKYIAWSRKISLIL